MQSKRDGLVPIGDALSDLGGPVQAIRDASPQALHHFTQADQVNQLVSASEADPRIRARLAQNTIDLPNLPIDDSCEDAKQAARRAGLAFEVALIQSAQSAVVDAPGEGV